MFYENRNAEGWDDDGYSFVCIYNLMRNSPQLKEEGKKTTHSDGGFAYEGAPVESLCSDDDFRWIHPLFSVHPRRQTPSSHLRVTVLWLWYMNLLSPNISRPDNNIFTAASSIYECVLFILEIYSHFLSKQFRLSRAAENTAMSKCIVKLGFFALWCAPRAIYKIKI